MSNVCAQHGHLVSKIPNYSRGCGISQVPYVRESCPETLASRKGGRSDPTSEGSETAKPGSNEQELDTEAVKAG